MKTPRALAPVLAVAALALAACGGSSSGGTPSAASRASASPSAVSSVGPSAASSAPADAASSSSGSSASSGGGGGGGVAASDKAFCDTFSSAKERFGNQAGLPTGEDINKIKAFAADLEKTAPSELKDDAKVLATYFRFIANVAGNGGVPSAGPGLEEQMTKLQPAIIHVTTWSATHCARSYRIRPSPPPG